MLKEDLLKDLKVLNANSSIRMPQSSFSFCASRTCYISTAAFFSRDKCCWSYDCLSYNHDQNQHNNCRSGSSSKSSPYGPAAPYGSFPRSQYRPPNYRLFLETTIYYLGLPRFERNPNMVIGGPQYRPQKYYSPFYRDPQKGTPNFGKETQTFPEGLHPLSCSAKRLQATFLSCSCSSLACSLG